MPADTDPSLVVRLQLEERDLTNITRYSLESAYLTSTDAFEFESKESEQESLLGLEMEPVELIVDGAPQLLGRIEQTEVGGNGSAVTFRGRDYLCDVVENNSDPLIKIQKNMTLGEAVLIAVAPVGITNMISDGDLPMRNVRTGRAVSNQPAPDVRTIQQEELKPQVNEGSYQFINRIIARHGATIQPANRRDTIVLTTPNYEQEPAYTLSRTADDANSSGNNILSATASRDYSKFPTFTMFNAKVGPVGKPKSDVVQTFDMITLASEFGGEIARVLNGKSTRGRRKPADAGPLSLGEVYRLLYLRDEQSRTPEMLERAARRAISERLKDTLLYNVTVRGHSDPHTGTVWAVDTMVQVNDSICGVNEPLWIQSRRFDYDSSNGATTTLECWRPSSFQI